MSGQLHLMNLFESQAAGVPRAFLVGATLNGRMYLGTRCFLLARSGRRDWLLIVDFFGQHTDCQEGEPEFGTKALMYCQRRTWQL